jgi:superfamily II DNA or RNA helicase
MTTQNIKTSEGGIDQNDFDEFISRFPIEPRPYQRRIAKKAIDYYSDSVRYLLIESPTGSGKTIMGLMLAKYAQERLGMTVGWAAMRRNLLIQTEAENKAKGLNVDIKYISMFDKNPPKVDFLIVDEAHHDATASMTTVHGKIKPTIILGLTATPFRTDRVGLAFEKVIKDADIRELMRDGYLSQFDHYTLGEYTPQSVVETYIKDPSKWGKSVVFFHKYEECVTALSLFRERGIAAEVVTGQSDRYKQIENFERGETRVLINMMVLTEGFDSPSIQTVFVRPSSRGTTCQMAGRVLRLYESIPIKNIVQCQSTKYPFVRKASPRKSFVLREGAWVALGESVALENVLKNVRKVMAHTKLSNKTTASIKYCTAYKTRRTWKGLDTVAEES